MREALIGLMLAAIGAANFDAVAQSAANDASVQDALKSMQSEIEKLRGENQKMRSEIDDFETFEW